MKPHPSNQSNSGRSKSAHDNINAKILLSIFKIFGLAPMSMVQNAKAPKDTAELMPTTIFLYSDLGNFYNVSLMIFIFGLNFVSIPLVYDNDYPNKTQLTEIIEITQAICGNVVCLFIWLTISLRQKTMVKILNRLMNVDMIIAKLIESSRVYLITIFLTNIFVWIEVIVSNQQCYNSAVLSWLNDIVPGIIVNLFMIQYVVIVKLVEKRFCALNRALINNANSLMNSVEPMQPLFLSDVTMNNCEPSKIMKLRSAHVELYEITCQIAEFYSLPIVFTIALSCYSIIYNAYYVIMPFLLDTEENTALIVANGISWLIGLMLPITMLAAGVNRINVELRKTGHAVHKLLIKPNISRTVKTELKEFSLELLQLEVHFTAAGLFPLDCTLVHSIFSMVVTYLIILFQFQMSNARRDKIQNLPNATTVKPNQ